VISPKQGRQLQMLESISQNPEHAEVLEELYTMAELLRSAARETSEETDRQKMLLQANVYESLAALLATGASASPALETVRA
jgi:hypothetical protein